MKIKASYHQERLWFIHQFEYEDLYQSGPVYHNIPLILEIEGPIDIEVMEQSLGIVVNRHEALRTRMITVAEELFQQVEAKMELMVQVLDLTTSSSKESNKLLLEIAITEAKRPFSLDSDPLIRAVLIKISPGKSFLVITLHHLISDRYSLGIIAAELVRCYQALQKRRSPRLFDIVLDYPDFSQWQRGLPQDFLEEILLYWKRKLAQLNPLELPTSRMRATIHIFREARAYFQLPGTLSRKIRDFSQQKDTGNHVLLLAAFKVLLHRYCGQEDIVVGTSGDNRPHPGTETMVGPAANLLVLRTNISSKKTFTTFFSHLTQTLEEALENQDIPFDLLALELNAHKDMSRTVFFDILFQYEEKPFNIPTIEGLDIKYIETNLGWGKYDLNLLIRGGEASFTGILVYNRDYYEASFITDFLRHYQLLLESILKEPDCMVSQLNMLSPEERHRLLEEWNQTHAHYPEDKTIHQLFAEQVQSTPDNIALLGPPQMKYRTYMTHISYRELNEKSNQLSRILDEKGVKPDTIVGIMLERSLEMIIGILGILKTGGAYMPIDPAYPVERINYMLADSGAKMLVTTGTPVGEGEKVRRWEGEKILFEEILETSKSNAYPSYLQGSSNPEEVLSISASTLTLTSTCQVCPVNLAYVIYTSGTTGRPKGCLVTHRNLVRLFKTDRFPFQLHPHETWIMAHSYCFDFSVWEMFGALLNGGRLMVPLSDQVRDIHLFLLLIKRHQVTILNHTPQAFYALAEAERKSRGSTLNHHLRTVVFGGDKLLPQNLSGWGDRYSPDHLKLINMYGITETTIHVTYYRIRETDLRSLYGISPIGKPLPETTLYILDNLLHPVPVGIGGEIFVGGTGVARGYLNRPELTAQKFQIPKKACYYRSYRSYILYKTGDLGRRLPDGNVEYLGRSDDQVQIRGFRIEPAEIENHLLNHPAVQETVVLAREDRISQLSLCAYIRLVPGQSLPPVSHLREYLDKSLPHYMIPSYFVPVNTIPLTINGKVDKKALPDPQVSQEKPNRVPPGTSVEKTLTGIWAEVLGLKKEDVSINDDFFDSGGHSLKATVLIARIHQKFNVKIPMMILFQAPQIKKLAEYITNQEQENYYAIGPAEEKKYYTLSPTQKRLYVLHQLVPNSTSYNVTFTIPLETPVDKEKLETIFTRLIARHESLRTSFIMIGQEPFQMIHEKVEFKIECNDISGVEVKVEEEEGTRGLAPLSIDSPNRSPQPAAALINSFIRPFDLSCTPLLRVGLIDPIPGGVESVLMIDMHHIITDATSLNILEREFRTLDEDPGQELEPLRLQYKDYSEWNNSILQQEALKQQESYWIKEFSGEIPVLNLPIDYSRPLIQSVEGNVVSFSFNVEETGNVKSIAAQNNSTLYMCLLAVFNVLLSKLCGQEDIIIGTPIAARRHADLQDVIGMLVNTLAIRNYPYGEKSFREFLKEVNQRSLDAFENQEYPFEVLVDKIIVDRDTRRNPVFDVMFNVLNQADYKVDASERNEQDSYLHIKGTSKFDMNLAAVEIGKRIFFTLEYSTCLFKPDRIEKIIGYFKNIVKVLSRDMGLKISRIEIMDKEEQKAVLRLSRGIKDDYEEMKTLHWWFEEQAARTPDHIAVTGQSVGMKYLQLLANANASASPIIQLSYRELNDSSNRLAYQLRDKGVGPDSIVGLMVERSVEMIIGMLAIMKAGGAYLPLDIYYPVERLNYMLKDSGVSILLTGDSVLENMPPGFLKNLNTSKKNPVITPARERIIDFNSLPIPDRSLVNYEKYHQYISSAMVKHSISIQATRGCPFKCIYCNKICTGKFVQRSPENVFAEIRRCYDFGIRRFTFIDDVFNLDEKNASALLRKLIKNRMDVQLFFANGLRGDILSKEFSDLMVEAGATTICVALESGSPRIQKLIKKNLNLEKFRDNVHYITRNYPHIILEMELMHGFPTETEEEALMTLDFLMDIKWVHFPDLHILKIYPNTGMYKLAAASGITGQQIQRSIHLAYHEIPETLPFSKDFTRRYQAKFLSDYFFSKERLLKILPYQVKALTEDELVQKYDSYLPYDIRSLSDILEYLGVSREELGGIELLPMDNMSAPNFSREMRAYFPGKKKAPDALRLLLLDLSLSFSSERNNRLYDVVEAPLGLMCLLTYLNEKIGDQVLGKIFKSRIDFDSYEELKEIILDFKPDLIGIRTLSTYEEFFHRSISLMRKWGVDVPIISGGPYVTTEYMEMLQDDYVDLAVLGEGELTIAQLIEEMLKNNKKLPGEEVLTNIPGIAFVKSVDKAKARENNCQILLMDKIAGESNRYSIENLKHISKPSDLAYLIYTSGSTGIPKGVMLGHGNLANLIEFDFKYTNMDFNKILQFHTISFDASFHEIFSVLLWGGQLVLVEDEVRMNVNELLKWVEKNRIKTLFLPMSFLKVIFNEDDYIKSIPRYVDHIQTAGEQVVISNGLRAYLKDNKNYLHNHYGPSETHVVTTLTIAPDGDIPELPTIGKPVMNTGIYIVDKWGRLSPPGVLGEIWIGGVQVGRGYLNRPELTAEKFVISHLSLVIGSSKSSPKTNDQCLSNNDHSHFPNDQCPMINDRLYKTGDLARWLPDGNIQFLGRIDQQVKIRGFRIEPGEIESQLLTYDGIKEIMVVAKADEKEDKYLCAYFVSDIDVNAEELRVFLSARLPDYMIPSYYIRVEQILLTPNGKVDRKALPTPGFAPGDNYIAPRNEIEKELLEIWSDLLSLEKEKISTNANFFQLGGHSLRAITMSAKIHIQLDVKVPLTKIFQSPSIQALGRYIEGAEIEEFKPLQPVEKKEYYFVSSAQKRLYFIQQMDVDSIVYNMPMMVSFDLKLLGLDMNKKKLEYTIYRLIERHESFRTSFVMIADRPVQKIHHSKDSNFEIEYYDLRGKAGDTAKMIESIFRDFVRPFRLFQVPLIRVGLVEIEYRNPILIVDMHHIISDGISHDILERDFVTLLQGGQLSPLRLQYKDYAEEQNREEIKKSIKAQEEYWLKEFKGEISLLNLPTDYPRTDEIHFQGESIVFTIDETRTATLKKLAGQLQVSLMMFLLSIYKVLLAQYSGQQEIIVGTVIAGRQHADLENIIGFFVNMLAIKSLHQKNKRFSEYVREVKEKAVKAYENQGYPFEVLVSKLAIPRQPGRHPLVDVVFSFQENQEKLDSNSSNVSHFDLMLVANDAGDSLQMVMEYSTGLFKKSTITELANFYMDILEQVVENPSIQLKDIRVHFNLSTSTSPVLQEDKAAWDL